MKDNKSEIQERKYEFPYHYIVDFKGYNNSKILPWGLEYYSYVSWIIDYVNKSNAKKIAEVGCGDGKILWELAKINPDKQFIGYDLSKKAIAFAKAFGYGIRNLQFHDKDFDNDKDKYDLILCVEVLEHIPDEKIAHFVENISDHLAKEGRLVISVPTKNVKLNPKHYRHYDLPLLKEHLKNFDLIDTHYIYKNNIINKILLSLFDQMGFKKLELYIGKRILFNANKKNGTHIVSIFESHIHQ